MDARADLLKTVASRPGYSAKVICIDNMPINDDASKMVQRFKNLLHVEYVLQDWWHIVPHRLLSLSNSHHSMAPYGARLFHNAVVKDDEGDLEAIKQGLAKGAFNKRYDIVVVVKYVIGLLKVWSNIYSYFMPFSRTDI
jgi:hypothetical protein